MPKCYGGGCSNSMIPKQNAWHTNMGWFDLECVGKSLLVIAVSLRIIQCCLKSEIGFELNQCHTFLNVKKRKKKKGILDPVNTPGLE